MGPEWVVFIILVVVVLLVATTGRRFGRGGGSTAGHYDPDAIGRYTLDPATMAYRFDLPTVPRPRTPGEPAEGPPHRRRRRRRRPDAAGG
jgi:hypothetical protein